MAADPSHMPMTAPRRARPKLRRALAEPDPSPMRDLIAGAVLELIPMKSLAGATEELRPGSHVSMTCSPAKSIEATLDESRTLLRAGHRVTPHISARMVRDHEHLVEIHDRLVELDLREIFVVAGDADPPGCFFDAIEFLEAFLELDDAVDGSGRRTRQIDHIGYTAYPDTHPLITNRQLHEALHTKQELILSTGRSAHVTTQMCFSSEQVRGWLHAERRAGLAVPVHLGVPGVVDKTKLMTMGVRLGVGTSMRYLKKNRKALGRMMAQRAFEPGLLLRPLADVVDELGIGGIHLFTFNQVDRTERWRERTLT